MGQLRGEFAVVLWDEANQTLLAARDRFGLGAPAAAKGAITRDGSHPVVESPRSRARTSRSFEAV